MSWIADYWHIILLLVLVCISLLFTYIEIPLWNQKQPQETAAQRAKLEAEREWAEKINESERLRYGDRSKQNEAAVPTPRNTPRVLATPAGVNVA